MIRILGCGNPLVGDDGIGIHVIERLQEMRSELPDDVELIDAGVCGLDMLNMLEDADTVIIIDAVKGAGNAGSVHRFGMDDIKGARSNGVLSIHETCLADVLCIAEHIQKMPENLTIFGVEIDKTDELSIGLSEKLQASMDVILTLILDEIRPGIGSCVSGIPTGE
jgi:hydrogenase maturation protease